MKTNTCSGTDSFLDFTDNYYYNYILVTWYQVVHLSLQPVTTLTCTWGISLYSRTENIGISSSNISSSLHHSLIPFNTSSKGESGSILYNIINTSTLLIYQSVQFRNTDWKQEIQSSVKVRCRWLMYTFRYLMVSFCWYAIFGCSGVLDWYD